MAYISASFRVHILFGHIILLMVRDIIVNVLSVDDALGQQQIQHLVNNHITTKTWYVSVWHTSIIIEESVVSRDICVVHGVSLLSNVYYIVCADNKLE